MDRILRFKKEIFLGVILLALFLLLTLSFFFTKPPVYNDEALYTDMVNNLVTKGVLGTDLFKDYMPGIEKYSYWYPPFYFLTLAPFYKILGSTLAVGRAFSLFAGVLSLFFIFLIARRYFKDKVFIFLTVALLVLDKYFQDGSIIIRMEILTLLLGLVSIFFFQFFLDRGKTKFLLLSGTLAGLSIFTHPTGVIFVLPIFLSLFFDGRNDFKTRIKNIFLFASPVAVIFFIWFLSFIKNLDVFILQSKLQFARKIYTFYFVPLLFKSKPYQTMVLVLYFLSNLLFLIRYFLKKNLTESEKLLLWLVLCSSILPVLFKEMWYLIYISVFACIAFANNMEFLWSKKLKIAWVLISFLILLNASIYYDTAKGILRVKESYNEFSEKISKVLPANSRVMFLVAPDPYFFLVKERPDLILREGPNSSSVEPINRENYEKSLSGADYVVLSYIFNQFLGDYLNTNVDKVLLNEESSDKNYVLVIKLKNERSWPTGNYKYSK